VQGAHVIQPFQAGPRREGLFCQCAALGRVAGGRDAMDSSGLVSATTSSEGAMTVVVGPRPESPGISGGGEAGETSCGEDEVGRAALIGIFARERSRLLSI
jgi:hypothetical protein